MGSVKHVAWGVILGQATAGTACNKLPRPTPQSCYTEFQSHLLSPMRFHLRFQATAPNIFYTRSGRVAYFAAAVGIVYDKPTQSQRLFLEHDDDITSMVGVRGAEGIRRLRPIVGTCGPGVGRDGEGGMGVDGSGGEWFTYSVQMDNMLKRSVLNICICWPLSWSSSPCCVLPLICRRLQAIHPDGRTIATGQVGHDPVAIIWDAEDMRTIQTIPQG